MVALADQLKFLKVAIPVPGMWNKPSDEELSRLPRLYETEKTSLENKIIHQHYFIGGSDWYMAEYDPNDRLFFGYTVLNKDYQNSEWGYTSLDELADINVWGIEVDRDVHWKPRRFAEIDEIPKGYKG